MKLTESPLLDDESMAVLTVAYRTRAATLGQLADLIDPSAVARFPETVGALASAGFLELRGEDLVLESPYAAFIAISQARAARLSAETTRTIALMSALPQLIRNWDLGEAGPGDQHPLVASIVHGRELRGPTLHRHIADHRPAGPCWVLPDAAMLDELLADSGTPTLGGRVITRASPSAAVSSTAKGLEVRILDDLPGWFYVDQEMLAALPVTWGEEDPSSMLLIRTPPVIAALGVVFESLWERAEPLVADPRGWEPVIRLLAQGMTDEAVARSLALDVRTVRRRVAEAMDELGAMSRFTLGAAWERRSVAVAR